MREAKLKTLSLAKKKIMDIEEELKIVGANMQVRQLPLTWMYMTMTNEPTSGGCF